jgi:hypothetical protein
VSVIYGRRMKKYKGIFLVGKLKISCHYATYSLIGIKDSEVLFIHFHSSIVYSMHTIVLAYECEAETGFVWCFTI